MPDSSFLHTQQDSSIYLWNPQLLRSPDTSIFAATPSADVQQNNLGRGTVVMFRRENLELVRRHYQRGGLVRHISRDIYLGRLVEKTRMWREFFLLQQLRQLQLPVPQPVAARCDKFAPLLYRGDLITLRIMHTRTLAEALRSESLSTNLWHELGTVLARFHLHGVYHADLNANNILLDQAGAFHLIDFDRGEIRKPDRIWQDNNLNRLLRSLHKLQGLHPQFYFDTGAWTALQNGYLKAHS